jgi:hypothetical protein
MIDKSTTNPQVGSGFTSSNHKYSCIIVIFSNLGNSINQVWRLLKNKYFILTKYKGLFGLLIQWDIWRHY